ncbi:MAG: hypothetical protein AAFQ82_01535 [Myxococcota bacterium]
MAPFAALLAPIGFFDGPIYLSWLARPEPARIHTYMLRTTAFALALSLGASPLWAAPIPASDAAGTLSIKDDDLGTYDIIPRRKPLTYELEGPGLLFLYLVNHRVERKKPPSRIELTLDGIKRKTVKLGCADATGRFEGQKRLLPCARVTEDLVIPAGSHTVGLQLAKTKFGASVHAIYTPSNAPPVDSSEPALVTTPGGDGASAATLVTGESSQGEPPPTPPPAAPPPSAPSEEPDLLLEPAPDALPLVPIEQSQLHAEAGPTSFGDALMKPVPLVLLGTAALLGGASVYFGLEMNSDFSAFNDRSSPTPQLDRPALEASGEDNRLLMFSFGGAAIVSAGAALIVAATSSSSPAVPAPTNQGSGFSAGCAGQGCAAFYQWSWP